MPHTIDLTPHGMVALTRTTLIALRAALMRDAGPAAAAYLQEAGYAGGEALFDSFRRWMDDRGLGVPEEQTLDDFQLYATDFFRDLGWGSLEITSMHDAVAALDTSDWAEANPDEASEHPTCHLTTGVFADFFGRVADNPLAVLEVECRSMGHERCRFLIGSAEVMQYVYEEMGKGVNYDAAVAGVD